MNFKKSFSIFLLLILLIPGWACLRSHPASGTTPVTAAQKEQAFLAKLSKYNDDVSVLNNTLSKSVVDAQAGGLIDLKLAGKLLNVSGKIAAGTTQIRVTVSAISKMDASSQSNVLAVLAVALNSFDAATLDLVSGIKDPATQQSVSTALSIMKSTLQTIQVIVANHQAGS